MGKQSGIEWTDATFNPWVGCQKVSAGCANCYAEREMTRKDRWANSWGPVETSTRVRTTDQYWGQPFRWMREVQRKAEGGDGFSPLKVFCGSLCDVFEDNPSLMKWRYELFDMIAKTRPELQWLVLTKRPRQARDFFRESPEQLADNLWLGTSIEDQETLDKRAPMMRDILLDNPSCKTFLSVEPLLEFVDLSGWVVMTDWVIVGGESGPNYRPMDPEWARAIRDTCNRWSVPFFFKQMAGVRPKTVAIPEDLAVRNFPIELA